MGFGGEGFEGVADLGFRCSMSLAWMWFSCIAAIPGQILGLS